MKLYLSGFMGAGKSTIGRELAAQTGFPFIDLDQEIEQRAGKHISTLFEDEGEPVFRKMETETLRSLVADPCVMATGGGSFIHNTEWMLQNGIVVYLQVPFETLAARVGADPARPLWRNAEALFAEREQTYRKAHIVVNANASPAEVAREIHTKILAFEMEGG